MHESLSKLSINTTTATNSGDLGIQMELVSEEEMASIEAALAAATPSSLSFSATPATRSPSQFQSKGKSIQPITSPPSKAKRKLSFCAESDIEDLGSLRSAQKRSRVVETSFFHRFRSKTGLYVSDVTSTVWNFFLLVCFRFGFWQWVWFSFWRFSCLIVVWSFQKWWWMLHS
jgi:hypothetical protein